ncbi:MAG TPA: NADH-quinone oxidoreductase subunit N [Kouleothrix sp.]|uniref:NADH-quinone oxidoreductase subunit N n=1 Tax=Kouleothrix sp. TaxID=2779161 RepID=UPI002C155A7E|nr:NADH-quinone oxidoreductase subunit N [Kouleothrix sp.]HRC74216.1 NADH-quinone oxidoreductase subunit N [Kouleothrix sp.]
MPPIQIPAVDIGVSLQLLIVFGGAMVLLMADLFTGPGSKRLIGYLALLVVAGAAAAGVPLWNGNGSTFGGMLVLDNFALTLNWIFLLSTAITIFISLDYLPRQGIERGEYYALVLFAAGGMMLLAQGTDLIVLFLGLELLSITLYVLAGFAYPRLTSEEAAMKYLLIGAFAAGFLVFGIALLYGATGTSSLVGIAQKLGSGLAADDVAFMLAGAALVIIGFGYKISMAPFHMWTPDVYEGSPTPVAAFMSVGTKGAGFAALARLLLVALGSQYATWAVILAILAAITMLIGNISAVAQTNVKRMLAYSSIGHAGYILMGVLAAGGAAGASRGVEGFLFYLLAYSLTNLGAFAVLIALEQRGEAAWDMGDFAGLWHRQPFLAVAMALCMFSLAGVPPTAGFWGKFYVFAAAWEAGLQWLAIVGVITSAIAAFFYLRIIVQMFMRDPVRDVRPVLDRNLAIGVGLAALGVIVFGIIPTPVIDLVQSSVLALGR